MQTKFKNHAGEEVLERYCMGMLSGSELESFEEHLLICPECQDRVVETDAHVGAMRTAAARLRREAPVGPEPAGRGSSRLLGSRLLWVAAVAILLVGTVWLARLRYSSGAADTPPVAVVLQAFRGEGALEARAPAGRPLVLQMDLQELPDFAAYELEIVDAGGSAAWRSRVEAAGRSLSAAVPARLAEGAYWVRLYAPGPERELLREYGLRVIAPLSH